ncbi:MAG: 30S ribosomal protein S2 [Candidatus Aenigmarchaeota archaeon]|nr:30S ribosomal protein S2 [Candidatus Aenigmarchaeota archaeon]
MLAEKTDYLTAGIHIGMKSCSKYMKKFVYKTREDGLSVFNLEEVDNRIAVAAKFLSRFKKIMVVSHKSVGDQAAKKFSDVVGAKAAIGRFSPGTLTNPSYRDFYEPDIVLITDPQIDSQAVVEAKKRRVPIAALCDTPHEGTDVDMIIPVNNNGKKALALTFYILAREMLKIKGNIKKDSEFKFTLKDFGDDTPKKEKQEVKEEDLEKYISVEIENVEPSKKPKAKKPKKESPKQEESQPQSESEAKEKPKKEQAAKKPKKEKEEQASVEAKEEKPAES